MMRAVRVLSILDLVRHLKCITLYSILMWSFLKKKNSRKGAIYSLVYLGILIHVLKILLQECITIYVSRKGAIYSLVYLGIIYL